MVLKKQSLKHSNSKTIDYQSLHLTQYVIPVDYQYDHKIAEKQLNDCNNDGDLSISSDEHFEQLERDVQNTKQKKNCHPCCIVITAFIVTFVVVFCIYYFIFA